jgi:hypothetical protein
MMEVNAGSPNRKGSKPMTSKQTVLDSLEKQKNAEWSDEVAAIKKEWLTSLDRLFGKISEWLRDAAERKLLEVKPGQIGVREERLGGYFAPSCDIVAPSGITLRIVPTARFIVGANGRVDLLCPPNEAILVRKNGDDWAFAELDAPRGWRFIPLTEESFWEVLGKLVG